MPTVVAVGACYLDTILTVDHYPAEDEKLRAVRLEKRRGGNVPNTLEVLQQLPVKHNNQSRSILLSVLPSSTSPATEQIKASLGSNVDLSHCFYRENSVEAPSSYIIRSVVNNSRTIVNYNELEEMTALDLQQVVNTLRDKKEVIYHFEGRIPDVISNCIDYIRIHHPESQISVEIEKPNRDGLRALAQKADVVFFSKSWALTEGYGNAAECVKSESSLATNASYLFCTWGADGATAYSTQDQWLIQVKAFTSEHTKVLDTVGAGDTFIAGVLYGLFYNPTWNLDRTLNFANELAGHKVAQHGFAGLHQKVVASLDLTT